MPHDRQFTDREVWMARAFCIVVGGVLALVGLKLSTGASSVPPLVAWILAGVGAGLAIFGALAPRKACVGAAGWVLTFLT